MTAIIQSTKRFIMMISLFIGIFLVAIWLVNLSFFDQALKPQVAQLLKPRPQAQADNNAYIALWGITAAADKKMLSAGQQLMSQFASKLAADKAGSSPEKSFALLITEAGLDNKALDKSWRQAIKKCNFRTQSGCLTQLSRDLEQDVFNQPRLKQMLNRYRQMTRLSDYSQLAATNHELPLPPYGVMMDLHKLSLLKAYNSDTPALMLQAIAEQDQFWRMLLTKGHSLIDKMIAIAGLWTQTQYLSEYIVNQPMTGAELELAKDLLASLTKQQLDISEAFGFEQSLLFPLWQAGNPVELEAVFALSASPISRLIQPNATMNDYFDAITGPMTCLSRLSQQNLFTEINNHRARVQFNDTQSCLPQSHPQMGYSPSSLYNLAGKLIVAASDYSPEDYIGRVNDLNNMIRLVKLQLSLKSVPKDKLLTHIQSSELTNLYTNQPMNFDNIKSWLSFDCLDRGSNCRVNLVPANRN